MTSTTRYSDDSDIYGIQILWTVGDPVEGGETEEDYDTGRIIAIDGDQITVAWSTGVRTTVPSNTIRDRSAR